MVEAAAEANEELMEKYLEEGELSIEEIKKGLRMRTLANEIVPVLLAVRRSRTRAFRRCWMPLSNILPAPDEVKAIRGDAGR